MTSATGAFRPTERIVVPVAGTDREFLAQQWAVELAAALGVRLDAVHVSNARDVDRTEVFAFLEGECRKWGVGLKTTILVGPDVPREIVEELGPRDLVIIGTRRLASHYHMGSVAAELIRTAPCPVQIVRLGA